MKKLFVLICLVILMPSFAFAVDFSFTDLDGNTYTSSTLKGSPIVINVGSHW